MMYSFCRGLLISLIVIGFALPAVEAGADMYACRDSSGSIRYTNAPSTSDCSILGSKARLQRNVWAPPAASAQSSYDRDIWVAGNRYNVDPLLIKAVIRAESGFNSRAVSQKGAQGLMQLMPETAREMRVRDPFNPADNINGGTRYLRRMLDAFGGDLVLSIAAYNAGPGAVKRARGVPRIPETVRYVVKVLEHYRGYRSEGKG